MIAGGRARPVAHRTGPAPASANDVVVDAELPGEVTLHTGVEGCASELELDAAPGHEAGAADHGVEPPEMVGEVDRGGGDEVAGKELDAEGLEFGDVSLFVGVVGSDC